MRNALNVLIVEDDELTAGLLQHRLRRELAGDIQVVGTVSDASEALTTQLFHLVLADYRLPDGLGLDLVRWEGVPLVLVTADPDRAVAAAAIRAGAYDILVKDLEGRYVDDLPLAIERAMSRREAERAAREAQLAARLARQEIARLDNFANTVSAALRLPLRTVEHTLEMVDRRAVRPLEAQALRLAQRGVGRAITLLDGLRELVSYSVPGSAIGTVDLAEVIDVEVAALGPRLSAAGVRVRRSSLPAAVGCRGALLRGTRNLLENVIQHAAPGGGAEVHVSGRTVDRHALISFRDDGPGLAVPSTRATLPFVTGASGSDRPDRKSVV